jgi:hypothetical protein
VLAQCCVHTCTFAGVLMKSITKLPKGGMLPMPADKPAVAQEWTTRPAAPNIPHPHTHKIKP